MISKRLTALMNYLTYNTVLGELLAPLSDMLLGIRNADGDAQVLSMLDFIGSGRATPWKGLTA